MIWHSRIRTSGLHRKGVALVIALIVLAGLLLLGLPFLFSQSTSLAGSRSFAYHQSATVGREAAEQFAMAAVAEAESEHLGPTVLPAIGSDRVLLAANLTAISIYSDMPRQANELPLIFPASAGVNDARTGVVISDEHAKLDPNHLDAAAWDRLIKAVLGGNADWDDNTVWDSEDGSPDSADAVDNDGEPGRDGNPLSNGDNDDGDAFGQLAEAISRLRFSLPGQRITIIEQLLLANPGHNIAARPSNSADYIGAAGPTGSYGFRRPLTRAELEQLRPFLSVHLLPPGRDGLIDLGNAVILNPQSNATVLDSDLSHLVKPGTVIAWNDPADPTVKPVYGTTNNQTSFFSSGNNPYTFAASRGFAISASPSVNLHQVHDHVRNALDVKALSAAPIERFATLDLTPTTTTAGAFVRLDPLSSGRELPPVDIGSSGIIGMESVATAHDPLGRIAATRSRRSVVQAVPQENALEKRWDAQDQLHALLVQRFGNAMDSWPKAMRRIQSIAPDTTTADAALAPHTGIAAATQPSLATGWFNRDNTNVDQRFPTHLNTDWRLAIGAAKPLDASAPTMALATVAGSNNVKLSEQEDIEKFPVDHVRPDGLAIDGTKHLGFQLRIDSDADHGPLRSVAGGASPNHELRARHLSFWIKPNTDNWGAATNADLIVPLIEARMPMANAGAQADASPTNPTTPGHNELQNLLGLYYDSKQECLVLVISPPIIEHTNDGPASLAGPIFKTPVDNRTTTFDLDERCLGSDEPNATNLFPMQPNPGALGNVWDETNALFTSRVSRLFKPNRIVTLCRVANTPDPANPSTLRPYFRKERWYHIMVVLGGTAPGMNRIIVDGLTGRDRTSNPPIQVKGATPSDDQLFTGDHLTLPAMPLAADIPFTAVTTGPNLLLPTISVTNVLGLTASDLFPARGMLRIGDEFIWYDSITTTATTSTFINCSRAHRQNTNVNGAPADYWPGIQQHLTGALVVPGGIRLSLTAGHFYGGGSTLAYPLPNGDPNLTGAHPWMIWSRIKNTAPVVSHPSIPTQVRYPSTATTLPLDTTFGVPTQFPPRGIVAIKIGGAIVQILAYSNALPVTNSLENIVDLTVAGWTFAPVAAAFPARANVDFNTPTPIDLAPEVVLIGIPLDSDPLVPGHYDITDNGDPFYLQIQHRDTARVEWLKYQQLLFNGTNGFILHRAGFGPQAPIGPDTRGQQRTDFAGKTITTLNPTDIFPDGSLVLPVQQELSSAGRFIATGDVVTLLPKIASAARPLRQVLVRYAAMDGYALTGGTAINDTKNEYFAFAQDFANCPELLGAEAKDYELLVWPGWSGVDLTPQNPQSHPTCQLPRIDLLGDSYNPNNARCFFGANDINHISTAGMNATDAAAWNAARALYVEATIDAVVAGAVEGVVQASTTVGVGIIRVVRGNSVLLTAADDIAIGDVVEASYNGFFQNQLGLVAIGGETYAWRQPFDSEATATISTLAALGETVPANNQRLAVIIGRGLLDNDLVHQPHGLGIGPKYTAGGTDRYQRGLLPAINLPIGPVALTETAIADQTWFRMIRGYQNNGTLNFNNDNRLDAPIALICAPDGLSSSTEIVGLTVPNTRSVYPTTPPSLQGHWYSTAPWLRGMYNTPDHVSRNAGDLVIGWWPRYASALPPSSVATSEHFRCRQYGWAGFPIAFHQARFDVVKATTGYETAELLVHNTAIDDLFTVEIRAAASGMDWKDSDIDGATVIPDLTTTPATFPATAAFTHSQFTNNAVSGAELHVTWHYLRDATHAPSASLQAIAEAGGRTPRFGPIRLRCLAPCTVLAVEEAK